MKLTRTAIRSKFVVLALLKTAWKFCHDTANPIAYRTLFRKNVRAGYLATEVIEFLTPTPHHAVIEIMFPQRFP